MMIAALALAAATVATPAVPTEDRVYVAFVAGACRSFVANPDLKPVDDHERGLFAAAWDAGRKEALDGPEPLTPAVCQAMMKEAKAKLRP